jgi:spermidine/putrescine transport system substrate-binding protein
MLKRVWLFALLLAACVPQGAPTPTPTFAPTATPIPLSGNAMLDALQQEIGWVCPEEVHGGTLRVYNWSTYIAEDTIPVFETLCGVTVVYSEFDNEDEMIANVSADPGAYDVIVPSNSAVELLAAENLLAPLDLQNIPNMVNVNPALLNPDYDPGNRYSLPYQWGTIGVAYNIDRVRTQITQWQQVFTYDRGDVAWLNESRSMLGLALHLIGYDPNSASPEEINAARDFLIANSGNVAQIADDSIGQEILADGTVDIVVEYSGDIFQLMADCACNDFAYVIPNDGAVLWVDNMAIPVDSPNKRLAEAFIDYILRPVVGANISNYIAYASPNQTAMNLGLIDENLLENPAIYPDEETQANLFVVRRSPEIEPLYNEAWEAVLAAVGGD